MDLRAAHARAVADRDEAHAQVAVAEQSLAERRQKADELDAVCAGLERAMEMYDKPPEERAPVTDRPVAGDADVMPALAQVDLSAILRAGEDASHTNLAFGALRVSGRPMGTDEIAAVVHRAGYDSSHEQIRSGLTWLLKKGRVVRVAPATWAMPREPTQDDFTPAAGAAGVSTAGENGHSTQRSVLVRAE